MRYAISLAFVLSLWAPSARASRLESIIWSKPSGAVLLKMDVERGFDRAGDPVVWVRWTTKGGRPISDLRQIKRLRRAFEAAVLLGKVVRVQRLVPRAKGKRAQITQRGMTVTLIDGKVRFSLSESGKAQLQTAQGHVSGRAPATPKIFDERDVRYMVEELEAAAPWRARRSRE